MSGKVLFDNGDGEYLKKELPLREILIPTCYEYHEIITTNYRCAAFVGQSGLPANQGVPSAN
jgi:hypothetical protein